MKWPRSRDPVWQCRALCANGRCRKSFTKAGLNSRYGSFFDTVTLSREGRVKRVVAGRTVKA
eukprot:127418-Amphidinium_carterae.1